MAGLPSAHLSLKELWKARCKAQACLRRPGHENETSDNPDAGFVASLLNCANRHGRGRTNRSGVRKVRKWTVARALARSSRSERPASGQRLAAKIQAGTGAAALRKRAAADRRRQR